MRQPRNDSSIWFAIAREGVVVWFENDENVEFETEVLDITSRVALDVELGLTGLAIHPDFPTDNRAFILFNESSLGGRSRLFSYTVDTNDYTFSNEQLILELDQPEANHNAGDLQFGNDDMLYISFGDGGEDPATSQDLTNLYGSILRIDVSVSPYQVPSDNPFNTGQALCSSGVSPTDTDCPEIFAYGFRNPWRFSIDRDTGDVWVGDVGAGAWEEADLVTAGGNYGWPIFEGSECFRGWPLWFLFYT